MHLLILFADAIEGYISENYHWAQTKEKHAVSCCD